MKIMVVCTVLHILWNYIFVIYFDLEIIGTAIAMFITNFSILIGCIWITNHQWDLQEALRVKLDDPFVFKFMWDYWKMAIPTMAVLLLDFATFEVMTIFSGYFGVPEQAACVILMNIYSILYNVSVGFQTVANA